MKEESQVSHARAAILAAIIVAAWLASACAPKAPVRSFDQLSERLKPGQTVYVIDADGREIRGRISELSDSALTLSGAGAGTRLPAERVRAVDRHGDPVWNGLFIGLGVGAAMALLADPREVRCPDGSSGCTDTQIGGRLAAVAVSGALGAGIDAMFRSRTPIYRAPESGALLAVIPLPAHRGAAVLVVLRF
jgi:hypothetical protein